ncbi:MAG: DnaJ domain-containing protein [Leptospira sp.]|nr:DnaJ domain-containing protein [Leptospira sp.]
MEEEDLLELALDFFGFERNFTEEDFKNRYRELAKKYHPDSSEFTSNILFNELNRSKTILEDFLGLKKQKEPTEYPPSKIKDLSYELYKLAKDIENRAILTYFEKTKGNPVYLNPEENPPLRELKESLEIPIQNYKKIIQEYPESIWVTDAQDSLRRLSIWIR